MFFDDAPQVLKRTAALRRAPPIPETGWRPPRDFPNLSGATLIGLDTETKELDWEHGPGWGRGKGHIVGVSLAAIDAHGNTGAWYWPVRHEVQTEYNCDPSQVFRFVKDVLETRIPKVGANLIYDCGWLATENIFVQGELHDVQFAEGLLVDNARVNLDFLGNKYVESGKETNLLYQWLRQAYGLGDKEDPRSFIYRSPPTLAGPYAEADALLPIRILQKQWSLLGAENLHTVYRMECDLIPLLIMMRLRGVKIDLNRTEELYDDLGKRFVVAQAELDTLAGESVNASAPSDLVKVFDKFKLPYPMTPTGKPSFKQDFLKALEHPIGKSINKIRGIEKLRNTFVKGYLLEGNVNGRIHASFNPMKGDDEGADSGRFSSSKPNLQNIPSRSELGKLVRSCFVPEGICWQKSDQSQVEYRMLVHHAVGERSEELRAQYRADPKTDYHKLTQGLVKRESGILIPRNADECNDETGRLTIKEINFGLLYGMSQNKLARTAGLSKDKAAHVFDAYHAGNPYVRATMRYYADLVQRQGYVETVLGRRTRFDLWEPKDVDYDNRAQPVPYYHAINIWGSKIQRAYEHKAINRALQGGAADQMKMWMLTAYKAGVFNVIGVPLLTVHDELDCDVMDESPIQNEAYAELDRIGHECLPLRCPLKVDTKRGPNWGAIG